MYCGIDLGSRNLVMAKWSEDPYKMSADGIPIIVPWDNSKNLTRTCVSFDKKEVMANDHCASKFSSAPDFCIGGCYEYYDKLSEEDIKFIENFCPCEVKTKDGITYFNLSSGSEKKRETPVFVPMCYYFEYIFYCLFKADRQMYYDRHILAQSQPSKNGLFTLSLPDRFGPRQLGLIKKTLEWQNYKNFFFVHSTLPLLVNYGSYDVKIGKYTKPYRVLFVDGGETHITFSIVNFHNATATIEYVKEMTSVSGRHFSMIMSDMLNCNKMDVLTERRKTFLSFMELVEKKKRDLNLPGQTDIDVDMEEFFEDEEDMDDFIVNVTTDDFAERSQDLVGKFTAELKEALTFIKTKLDNKLDCVLPIGGAMRTLVLRNVLLDTCKEYVSKLTETMNMDECFAVGATQISHMISAHELCIREQVMEEFCDVSMMSEEMRMSLEHPNEGAFTIALSEIYESHKSTEEMPENVDSKKEETIEIMKDIEKCEKELHQIHFRCRDLEVAFSKFKEFPANYELFFNLPEDNIEYYVFFMAASELLNVTDETKIEKKYEKFNGDKNTKNQRWWAKFRDCFAAANQLRSDYKSCYDKVNRIMYGTSRNKLQLADIENGIKEEEEIRKRIEEVEREIGLFRYQLMKRF